MQKAFVLCRLIALNDICILGFKCNSLKWLPRQSWADQRYLEMEEREQAEETKTTTLRAWKKPEMPKLHCWIYWHITTTGTLNVYEIPQGFHIQSMLKSSMHSWAPYISSLYAYHTQRVHICIHVSNHKKLDHLAPRNHIIWAFNLVSLWFIAFIVRFVDIL